MKLKTWLAYSYVLLALMVISVSVFGIYFMEKLTKASDNILEDNYESVVYLENMIDAIDEIDNYFVILHFGNQNMKLMVNENYNSYRSKFLDNLVLEENNITEPGENELVSKLRKEFEDYIKISESSDTGSSVENYYHIIIYPKYGLVKDLCFEILNLNQDAILKKNSEAKKLSKDVEIYMIAVSFIALLIAGLVLIKIPNLVINPIIELTHKVKEISEKKYSQRLNIDSENELGMLAAEFNTMAMKLEEYEKTNIEKFIAEKKRAEAIVKSMRDGILVMDKSNNILLINSVSEELFGISEENLVGKNIFEISNYNNLIKTISKDIFDDGNDYKEKNQNYIRITYKEKEEFFLKEAIKVFDEKDNHPLGTIILLKNVTGFKELDEIKSGFVATVSHELRTPLTAMSMSLRLLQDKRIGEINKEQSKLIDSMKQEVKRLLKMVKELLNLSRIESGNEIIKYQIVSADDILDAAITPMLMQIEQKKIKLELKIESSIPQFKADTNKIAWVLINLLSNAVRYTHEGGNIFVTAGRKGNEIIFSVKDSGKGIEPNNIAKIFEKFVQLDSKNIENNKSGAGLGLAISKEFVNAHGGRIWVESEVGKGATFYFTIPVTSG